MVSIEALRDLFWIAAGGMTPDDIVRDHGFSPCPVLGNDRLIERGLIEYAAAGLKICRVMPATQKDGENSPQTIMSFALIVINRSINQCMRAHLTVLRSAMQMLKCLFDELNRCPGTNEHTIRRRSCQFKHLGA